MEKIDIRSYIIGNAENFMYYEISDFEEALSKLKLLGDDWVIYECKVANRVSKTGETHCLKPLVCFGFDGRLTADVFSVLMNKTEVHIDWWENGEKLN